MASETPKTKAQLLDDLYEAFKRDTSTKPTSPVQWTRGAPLRKPRARDAFLVDIPHIEPSQPDHPKVTSMGLLSRELCTAPYNTLTSGEKTFLRDHIGCIWSSIPASEQNRLKNLPPNQMTADEKAHMRRALCSRDVFAPTEHAPMPSMIPFYTEDLMGNT